MTTRGRIITGSCDVRLQRTSTHKARKPYKCWSCGAEIQPGQKYAYTVVFWYDKTRSTFRQCANCAELEDWLISRLGYWGECHDVDGEGPVNWFWEYFEPGDVDHLVNAKEHPLPAHLADWIKGTW